MHKTIKLPEIIPVFPLSNFIFFPKTTAPLNIFEKRYLEVSSCSNFESFQSMRGKIKYRNTKTNKLEYLHTDRKSVV